MLFLSCFAMSAQEGISFYVGSWDSAVEKARAEQKMVFVDCYTQWCGPCYNMAKNVFVLYDVAAFYNSNFICVKLDAESEEGRPIAQKYGVKSYPTYLFIDPASEEAVHRSSSRQDPDVFIYTGTSALNPEKRSTYLEKRFAEGCADPAFLLDYATYKGSVYDSKSAQDVMERLLVIPGYSLENPGVWSLYKKYIKGVDNAGFATLCASVDKMRELYGTSAVNDKLYSECQYIHEDEKWAPIPDFPGKEQIRILDKAHIAQQEGNYELACKLVDSVLPYDGEAMDKVCNLLYYISRSDLYGDCPDIWHQKCLEVSRFVAYNISERDDVNYHHNYAVHLEWALKHGGTLTEDPAFGTKEYNLRPRDLKKKPVKK